MKPINTIAGSLRHKTGQLLDQLLDKLQIPQRIANKIGYGYALALGTAISGTALGLTLGNYYSRQAETKVHLYTDKQHLLNELNSQILSIQMHPLRLLAVTDNSIWRQYEINQFNTDLNQLRTLLNKIDQFSQTSGVSLNQNQQLSSLGQGYQTALTAYEDFVQSLWQTLNNSPTKNEANRLLSAGLSSDNASEVSLKFETLAEDLVRLRQTANQEQYRAETQFHQSETLGLIIILGSMTLSAGLAIALALFTSRTIAKPIEQVTVIAQQVTESASFDIQVPIETRDEVALLATALNQLISWTGQYTLELQQARNTLEQRVQARTHDLQQSETQLRQQTEALQDTLAELQQAQLQLVESEKMSSLGQMVAGIAHEINNPVGFIHGNLKHSKAFTDDLFYLIDLYQQHYPQPVEEIEAALEEIDLDFVKQDFPNLMDSMRLGTERIKKIVLSLRTFSRLDEAELKAIDIHESLDSTLTLLQNRTRATSQRGDITITKHYAQLPLVECYAKEINQVFMHVLNNAIDALDRSYGKDISRKLKTPQNTVATLTAPPASSQTALAIEIMTQQVDEEAIAIHITDNGPGIQEAAQGKVFDPFFTTKAVGNGTGMGLSTSHQIVTERHRGQLTFESHPDRGTTFTIQIPLKVSRA